MTDANNLPIILSETPEAAAASLEQFKRLLVAFDNGAMETPVGDAVNDAFTTGKTDALDVIVGICDRDRNLPGGAISTALQNSIGAATELCKNEMRFKKMDAKGVKYLCEEITKNDVKAPRWMHNLRAEFDKLYAVRAKASDGDNTPKTFDQKFEALCAAMLKKGLGEPLIRAAFKAGLQGAATKQAEGKKKAA